jgi:hypothetical protein
LVAVALIGSIGASSQQQASADHPVGGAKTFKELTNDFEKNVINALKDQRQGSSPAVGSSPTDMRELLSDYIVDVKRILGGQDTLDTLPNLVLALIQNYERDVTTIFDQIPPDDATQIKDFRATTHDFVKAVIGSAEPMF